MMKRKNLYALCSCLFLSGCGMIDYHPYDVRISGETEVNAHNIERIEASCQGKTTIRFVTMGDSQRWYDETEDFVKAINQRNDIDFVIHGGDMSDFGLTKEFLWQRDIMNGLHVPYVALIGNHDCLGTGAETYKAVFGSTNFSFIAGNVKFVCLNTNALEYDYSEPVPDFTFMENEITNRREEFEKTVICMHARPYTDVFNDNVAKVFQHYVKQYAGIQFCTAAHTHHYQDDVIFDDGIHYVTSDCMDYRTYLVFTITPENTNMSWLNTNYILRAGVLYVLLLLSGLMSATCQTNAPEQTQHTRYDNRVHRFRRNWERIIPTHSKIQYAGNMGLLSFGTGWDYGKRNQWETDVLLGFIPKYSSKKAKVTMTLKQNYMPWSINIGKGFSTEPLACGLYVNTVFGNQFWVNEPERYPKGYYGFSSKVRFHVFMGQRLTYDIDPQRRFMAKSVTFFYEISTCDLYVISAVNNSYLRPRDYLSLSFGLKFQWF